METAWDKPDMRVLWNRRGDKASSVDLDTATAPGSLTGNPPVRSLWRANKLH
jgi:hypothetical protein